MNRATGSRKQKKSTITLIGEGITEQYYFKHVRSIYGYRYNLKPYFFGTTSLMDMDKKITKVINEGGIAICVFDTDVSQRDEVEKKKLNTLFKKYQKKKSVIFCDSLPSVEYWFLLHYKDTNRHFKDSSAVEKELRSFIAGYKKTTNFLEKEKWVSDMCSEGRLEAAISRSKTYENSGQSYSNIHKAFDKFKE